ncbi:HAD family hydrolase, partial [Pseudomonas syringae pv. japonica str. M301072]
KADPKRKLPVLNFGGQSQELWCDGGEIGFVTQLIQESALLPSQVAWFSTLVSKASNLPPIQSALKKAGKRVIMITNAHRDSLSLKMERIELAPYFERLISSHDYGFPKESQHFWDALKAETAFDPARSLFIDDTLPILRSARHFGVAHLLAV